MLAQSGVSIGHLIVGAIDTFSERTAFVMDGRRLTYRQFGDIVYRFCRALLALGLKRGDALAIVTSNSPEVFAVRCACAILGMTYTPLNARATAESHAAILTDADVSIIVTDASCVATAERARALCDRKPRMVTLTGAEAENLIALSERQSGAFFAPAANESDTDLVVYTGGTTGRAKGVMHSHKGSVWASFMNVVSWESVPGPQVLLSSPLSHSGLLLPLPTMLKGGTVHLLPGFDAERLIDVIEKEQIDTTLMVPSMIYALLDAPSLSRRDVSSLSYLLYGGAPIAPARLGDGLERLGQIFCQLYGQTEAPNIIAQLRRDQHDLSKPERLASCGKPAAGVEVSLLDERGQPADEGEICVRGGLVMDGYRNNPEATAEALRDGWLHTGDVARRDGEGFLYIVDRKKDMIISGGFNIYSKEVEDALAEHPAVFQAAVIGTPHEKWGEAVMAYVVVRPGEKVAPEELMAKVKALKGPHMAPKAIEFVEALPLTAVGKVDKPALRAPHWSGATRQVG